MMVRVLALPLMLSLAACGSEGTVETTALTVEQIRQTEDIVVTADPIELCTITEGEHLAAPTGGNVSTSSSNGVTISVMGS